MPPAADGPVGPVEHLVVGQGLDDTLALGRLVRQTRVRLGESAQDIATRAGISVSYVRAIERGDRAPAPAVARDVFAALGFQAVEGPERGGRHVDLVVARDGKEWHVDFKHWTGTAAHAGESSALQAIVSLAQMIASRQEDPPPAGADKKQAGRAGGPLLLSLMTHGIAGLFTPPAAQPPEADQQLGLLVRRLAALDQTALDAVARFVDGLAAAEPDAVASGGPRREAASRGADLVSAEGRATELAVRDQPPSWPEGS